MKRGFRGQAIYLVQSPPILGDLGAEADPNEAMGTDVYTVAPAGEG